VPHGEYLVSWPHVVIRLAIQESPDFLPRPALTLVSSVTTMGPSMVLSAIIAHSRRRTSATPVGTSAARSPSSTSSRRLWIRWSPFFRVARINATVTIFTQGCRARWDARYQNMVKAPGG
jgi:hypothetical protein